MVGTDLPLHRGNPLNGNALDPTSPSYLSTLTPHSASWGEVEIIRKLGQRGDNSGDKLD